MTRVYVFCEGQTEETFVKAVLVEHFSRLDIWLHPIIIHTSKHGRGGVSTYGKIKSQIERQCKQDQGAWITTLLDFYGLPSDFPGLSDDQRNCSFNRAQAVEQRFQSDIAQSNFIANLIVHEFEGLLFSSPQVFERWFDEQDIVKQLNHVRSQYSTPEHINDGKSTAPSKRILDICSHYDKVLHGSAIALDIGLDVIRKECELFNKWIIRIEGLK